MKPMICIALAATLAFAGANLLTRRGKWKL